MKKWEGSTPIFCDICGNRFHQSFVDGRTVMGPWGLLCPDCHAMHGVGLGIGKGQKYQRTGPDWKLVEGPGA